VNLDTLEKNLGELLEESAARFGQKTAIIFDHDGISLTFHELNENVNRYASALRTAGIGQRDHVAVMLPNRMEFPLIWLALARLGAVMVPVNARYQTEDLAYALNDSDAVALIIDSALAPVFRKIRERCPGVEKALLLGKGEQDLGSSLAALVKSSSAEFTPAEVERDDVMNIQYTSGTTGFPKGAVTTHEYWLVIAMAGAEHLLEDDVFLALTPFYYMDPQWELAMTLRAGCTYVFARTMDAELYVNCIEKYRVTCTWAEEDLLLLPGSEDHRISSLRYVLLSAFPKELHRRFEERFDVIAREVYGMTEIGVGTVVPIEDRHMVGSGSVGKLPEIREARIVDENGNDVPQGEVGELLIKGPGICRGYYNKPEKTAEDFEGGYFRTGDLFRVDENGYYYIVGRKKDMIRRMGDNISAAEVENVLIGHPKIANAAVVGVPDEVRDEEVKAYIIPAPGETPESVPPEEIIAFSLERLAKFKVPRFIEYRDSLPMTPSEKVRKHLLVAEKEDLTAGCWDRFART
jgi:crotonobetaine/carnitine-CoA ligase